MDEWVWITRAGVAVALVLALVNTSWIVVQARRAKRDDAERRAREARDAQAERELEALVEELMKPHPGGSGWMMIVPGCGFELGAELGVRRGTLRGTWHLGRLTVRIASLYDRADDE